MRLCLDAQYIHRSGPEGVMQWCRYLNALQLWLQRPLPAVIQSLSTQLKIKLAFSSGLLQCYLLYHLLPTAISRALSVSPVSCSLTQWGILFSK